MSATCWPRSWPKRRPLPAAAALIQIDYDVLEPVTDMHRALVRTPKIHPTATCCRARLRPRRHGQARAATAYTARGVFQTSASGTAIWSQVRHYQSPPVTSYRATNDEFRAFKVLRYGRQTTIHRSLTY